MTIAKLKNTLKTYDRRYSIQKLNKASLDVLDTAIDGNLMTTV